MALKEHIKSVAYIVARLRKILHAGQQQLLRWRTRLHQCCAPQRTQCGRAPAGTVGHQNAILVNHLLRAVRCSARGTQPLAKHQGAAMRRSKRSQRVRIIRVAGIVCNCSAQHWLKALQRHLITVERKATHRQALHCLLRRQLAIPHQNTALKILHKLRLVAHKRFGERVPKKFRPPVCHKEVAESRLDCVARLGKSKRTARHGVSGKARLLEAQFGRQRAKYYSAAHCHIWVMLQTPAKEILRFSAVNNQRST